MAQNCDESENGDAEEGFRSGKVAGGSAWVLGEAEEIAGDENQSEEAKEDDEDVCDARGDATPALDERHGNAKQCECQRHKGSDGVGRHGTGGCERNRAQTKVDLSEVGYADGGAEEGDEASEDECQTA